MARPHPALLPLAAGRRPAPVAGVLADGGLLASALDHGMQGLLWSWVRECAPGYELRERLAGLDVATRQRNDRLGETLLVVRERLVALDVDVAAVKGVTAEARWYERAGERPSSDVDVLVAPAARHRAGEIVRALEPGHPLADAIDDLVRSSAVQSVDLRVDGVAVDLHFDLMKLGYPMRSPDAAWRQTEMLVRPGVPAVRVLRPELALVHFLVHANKDSFPRLIGYADVVRVMRAGGLDWDLVWQLARDEGLDVVVACALATVTKALAVVPEPVHIEPGTRTRIWHAVWPDRVTLLGASGTARSRRQEVLPFLVRRRGIDAVRGAVRVVFPAGASVAKSYPDVRGPYAVRLARGRWQSMVARRSALRARHVVPDATSGVDGTTKAGLLRTRLAEAPMWLDVSGRSMGWSIPGGSRVRLVAGVDAPRRGEVWAFCRPDGALVVHRARGSTADGLVFQGDVCVNADAPVSADRLVGRVVEVEAADRRRWGAAAGAVQRLPRVAVAAAVRAGRQWRGRAGREGRGA